MAAFGGGRKTDFFRDLQQMLNGQEQPECFALPVGARWKARLGFDCSGCSMTPGRCHIPRVAAVRCLSSDSFLARSHQ